MERWYSMVHLQMRSSYSLLESPIRLESMILHQKQLGYNHVCLTDHNVMYGTMEFYQLCKNIMSMRLLV